MKNTMLKYWFMLVLLMFAACQEKEELNHVAKGSVSLKASIENSDARTTVDEEGHVSWVVADAIGVFGGETQNAMFQSLSSGSSVLFVGEMSSQQDVPALAYYPYDEHATLDGNTLHFTLPSEYAYTGESKAPMLGIKQADGDFIFKHLCGLLKITVKNMPENAKRLFVVSEGTEEKEAPAIAGGVVVSDVSAEGATLSLEEKGGHEVSIDLENTSAQETYTFYIPVPVGEYPRLSVKLEMNDGVIYMDKSVSNVNMVRAKMLEMPLIDLFEKKPDLGENMVLSDNTVLLTEDFSQYVFNSISDDGIIVLNTAFPEEQLPVVGDILFYGDTSESFPNGLLNRILQIEKSDEGYKLITEPAALEDAFDKLYINQESILDFKEDNISRGVTDILPNFPFPFKRLPYFDNEGFVGYQHIWGFKLGRGFELASDNEKVNWSFSGNGEFSIDANLFYAAKLRTHIEIDKELDKSFISFLLDCKIGGSSDIISNANYNGNLEIQLLELEFNPLPLTPQGAAVKLLINPKFGVNLFLDLNAEMELEWKNTFEKRYQIAYLNNKGENVEWNAKEIKGAEDKNDLNSTSLNLGGSITVGVSVGFEPELACGTATAELPIKLGVKGKKDSFIHADENGNYSYELLKDEKIERSVELTAGLTFKTPLLKSKENINNGNADKFFTSTLPLLNLTFPWDTLYYVPEFRVLSSYDYGDKYSVLYEIDRDLIWPTELNLVLKNDEDTVLKESDNKLTYWSWLITGENTIGAEFSELDPKDSYSICPVVTIPVFGKMYAEPVLEIIRIKVYTEKYEKDNFTGSIICYGRFDKLDDTVNISEYGICYNLQSEPAERYLVPSEYIKDDFTFSSSLSHLKSGIYEYRAYFKIDDKYYYADETNSFEVKSESVVTIEATNITQTTATLSGNIQGYGADDFQHRYGFIYSTDATPSASNGTIVYSDNILEDGNYSVDVASLTQNTTYYYRAFVIDGGNYVYGDVKSFTTLNEMSERDILIAFYNATDGDNWRNNTNWCSDYPLGAWYGVETDANGKVIELRLQNSNANEKFGLKGYANLSGMKHLESIKLAGNELTSIDVSGCVALKVLDCYYNQLTNLNVSDCFVLERLSCISNMLTSLNISDCTSLKQLFCHYNQLTSLNLIGLTRLEQLSCEANSLSLLELSNCTSLKELSCSENQLSSLDVSNCTALNTLQCSRNKLTSLDVSNCTVLRLLECGLNQLTSLDVSGLTKLEYLECGSNELISLDISDCTFLKCLRCSVNQLTSLDLFGHAVLEELYCSHNKLVALDISNCTSLTFLDCTYNPLTSLNASDCVSLGNIYCCDNQLVSLNLSGCNALFKLNCSNNRLSSLDLSSCPSLRDLNCQKNQLTSLDMSDFSMLEYLNCYNNQLVSLDVSGCTSLKSLSCSKNKIVSVIPDWFSQLSFSYDQRYSYKKVYENGQEFIKYEDKGVGWWYPGEPDRGYHKE